nr:peptidase C48, SUMO/sentrin/Ubl1 [Tanacetum cinerariifolium]
MNHICHGESYKAICHEKGDEKEDDKEKDEKEGDEEEDEEESDEEDDKEKVDGEEDEKDGKGEVVMSKGKKIKVEDKEVGEKKRKKDSKPSSSEDEKPLKKNTKGKGNGPSKPTKKVLSDNQIRREKFLSDNPPLLSRTIPSSFFHAIRDAKVNMKSFMEDIGFSALHSVNIDTLLNRLARFVVRALDSKTYNFYLKTGVVHVTAEKVHEILGLPIGGISLYDLPERREDDEFVQLWLSQFASKKKKRIFATDIAEKLVRSTRVDFMFKVNFLMIFANVMGKADTMRAFVNLSVVRRIREDTNIAGLDWCDFIHRCLAISHEPNTVSGFYNGPLCFLILLYLDSTKFDRFPIIRSRPAIKNWSTKNMSTRQYLEIEDEAFGKLDIYEEWSENETVEAEGFCGNALVLPHTNKKIICEMIEEKLSKISKEKAEVEPLLRDANKEFPSDDNVKQLFEQYKGFFKETVLLEEAKAQKAPQNVKPKPAAVKTKEAAEKPKPAENVKELVEKPKEPAEKAQEAPQNVKPKPAAVKTNKVAEKPKPVENVKEVAEKPKEPADKAQKAPQYVKPKPAAVKTKEAVEKPMPAKNVKELANKPKEPAGDDYQVAPAATVMKAEDREEFEVETFTQWIEGNIDWVGEVIDNKGYVKPVKTVNTPYMCRRIDVIARCNRIEFVLGNSLFAMEGDKYEIVFQSLGGYRELSSVRVNMETLAPTLCIDVNVINCWVALLNFEELALGYPTPIRHFFPTGCIVFFLIYASDHFYVVVFNIKKPKTMVILDNSDSGYGYASKYKEACDPLKKLFSRYLKEQYHSSHEAVAKMRPFIPKLKWRTSNNHVDCGVFAMIHMENYVGDAAKN